MKRGFTLLEILVASMLLSMMVVVLSMVFSSSAIAWRTGTSGVKGMNDFRHNMSQYQLAADNALPHLKGEHTGIGYVRAVWVNGSSLVDVSGKNVGNGRGFSTSYGGSGDSKYSVSGSTKPSEKKSGSSVNTESATGYIIGVGSAGPDMKWNTKDDIATWPSDSDGGV